MSYPFDVILSAFGEKRLRQHLAARTPLHVPAPSGFKPQELFSSAHLADLFVRRLVPLESLRVMAGRRKLDLAALGAADGIWVHPLAMSMLARRGVTMAAFNVDRSVPALWSFASDAENWFGDQISISAVASFDCGSGLDLHYDSLNLLIIQIEGQKRWTFYGGPTPGPGRRQLKAEPISDFSSTGEVLMRAGDVMFVPAGLRHCCDPLGPSLHLGVLVNHLSGVAAAEHLLDQAKNDSVLNEFHVPPLGAIACKEQTEAFRVRLIELARELDICELFARQRLSKMRLRRMDWAGTADPANSETLAELVLSHWPEGIAGRIEVRGAKLTITPEAQELARALQGGPLTIDRLTKSVAGTVRPERVVAALKALTDAGLVSLRG